MLVVAIGTGLIELDGCSVGQFRHYRRAVRAELRQYRIKLVHCGQSYRLSRTQKKKFAGCEHNTAIFTKPMDFVKACHAAISYIAPSNPEK